MEKIDWIEAHLDTEKKPILVVDLDGSLLNCDTLIESIVALFKIDPLKIFVSISELIRGKNHFKIFLSCFLLKTKWSLSIPYNKDVLDILEKAKMAGYQIILATGSSYLIANQISKNTGLFDDIIATDESTNCIGYKKLFSLKTKIGNRKFIYFGNSKDDIPIWNDCVCGYVVQSVWFYNRLPNQLQKI